MVKKGLLVKLLAYTLTLVASVLVVVTVVKVVNNDKGIRKPVVSEVSNNEISANTVSEDAVVVSDNTVYEELDNLEYIEAVRWLFDREAGPKYFEETYNKYENALEWDLVYQKGLEYDGKAPANSELNEKEWENEFGYPIYEYVANEFSGDMEVVSKTSGTKEEFNRALDAIPVDSFNIGMLHSIFPSNLWKMSGKTYDEYYAETPDLTKEEFRASVANEVENYSKFSFNFDRGPEVYPEVVDNKLVLVNDRTITQDVYTCYLNEKHKIYKIEKYSTNFDWVTQEHIDRLTKPEDLVFNNLTEFVCKGEPLEIRHEKELREMLVMVSMYNRFNEIGHIGNTIYFMSDYQDESVEINHVYNTAQYLDCQWQIGELTQDECYEALGIVIEY